MGTVSVSFGGSDCCAQAELKVPQNRDKLVAPASQALRSAYVQGYEFIVE